VVGRWVNGWLRWQLAWRGAGATHGRGVGVGAVTGVAAGEEGGGGGAHLSRRDLFLCQRSPARRSGGSLYSGSGGARLPIQFRWILMCLMSTSSSGQFGMDQGQLNVILLHKDMVARLTTPLISDGDQIWVDSGTILGPVPSFPFYLFGWICSGGHMTTITNNF
jgi:hypothetical protein